MDTIYTTLNDYSEKEIDAVINKLSPEDKEIIRKNNGSDLHNPKESDDCTPRDKDLYNNYLIPRMKTLLNESRKIKIPRPPIIETYDTYTAKLIELIKVGKSNREICNELGIDHAQLSRSLLQLKNSGSIVSEKYYSDGTIRYHVIQSPSARDKSAMESIPDIKTLITKPNENELKFLAIADLHFGSIEARQDLADRAFNYCTKNGINIILCGGDLIDGPPTEFGQQIKSIPRQIEFFVNNYPYNKGILTFSAVGNHDRKAQKESSLYLPEICKEVRPDIIFGSDEKTSIDIKNEQIMLCHIFKSTLCPNNVALIMSAHQHNYYVEMNNGRLHVRIPSLSNILQNKPSALEITVLFEGGYISVVTIKQILFEDTDYPINESRFTLRRSRTVTKGFVINNTENYI